MKSKILLAVLSAVACVSVAHAASEKYTATVKPRMFKLADATAQHPIPLHATVGEACAFDISMIVVKMDNGGFTATGRVTGGQCHGKPVTEGVVLGSIDDQDEYGTVELAPTVDIVLLKP